MNYISVCSGIEAASVAWHPLGWRPFAFSEIEKFPSRVLAHHYPDTPNFGDMTKFQEWPDATIDVLVGGTPCQSFSVAGLRAGLADPRGNLMLTYLAIAGKYRPKWLVWENVPGVLSSNGGRDFGALLGGLAKLGYGFAYRILDAQYVRVDGLGRAVPQRRRRVFVVGCLGDWRRAAAVLFERESLRGNSAPSRKAGEVVTGTISSRTTGGGGLGTDFDLAGGLQQWPAVAPTISVGSGGSCGHQYRQKGGEDGLIQWPAGVAPVCMAHGQGGAEINTDGGAPTLTCNHEAPIVAGVAHSLRAGGFDASEDGTGRGTPLVPIAFGWQNSSQQGASASASAEITPTLDKSKTPGVMCDTFAQQGITQGLEYASTLETHPGTLLRTLRQEAGEEAFAKWGLGILVSLQQEEVLRQALHGVSIRPASFSRSWVVCCALGFPVYGYAWLLQSLREAGCDRCTSQGWEPSEQLAGELGAYLSELSRPGAQAARFMRDLWLASEGFGLLQQALLAAQEVGRPASRKGQSVLRGPKGRRAETPEDVSSARMQCEASRERVLHETCAAGEAQDYRNGTTEQERSGKGWVGETPFAVRRLTVEECEFLQGFPRGYSKIPWRNKPANECPDGPRYKALGNSFAVNVVRWIGTRIAMVDAIDARVEIAA